MVMADPVDGKDGKDGRSAGFGEMLPWSLLLFNRRWTSPRYRQREAWQHLCYCVHGLPEPLRLGRENVQSSLPERPRHGNRRVLEEATVKHSG